MVIGLNLFKEHFAEHSDHYILIGGGACDWLFEQKGLAFRATKDLDIILIVEVISDEFVTHFWKFILDGKYEIAQVGTKKSYYRFIKPKTNGYPKMIELFSRRPDLIKEIPGMHLTDIPTGEEISSLSAILLDDNYYNFTLANSLLSDNLHVANDIALICLKVKAFLNNSMRKEEGQEVEKENIFKHKNDVIRLIVTLNKDSKVEVPYIIKEDLQQFINIIRNENFDVKFILLPLGLANITLKQIIEQLSYTFNLTT